MLLLIARMYLLPTSSTCTAFTSAQKACYENNKIEQNINLYIKPLKMFPLIYLIHIYIVLYKLTKQTTTSICFLETIKLF